MTAKRILLSAIAGFAISVVLLALEAHRHDDDVMLLQYPGLFAAAEIWGVHSGSRRFLPVMLLVNTLVYGFIVVVVWALVQWLGKIVR